MLRYPEQCSMIALYHYRDSLFLFFMCKRTLFIFFNYFNQVEGEAGEPSFRRLVLRSVAHIIRLYSSSLITECEVGSISFSIQVTGPTNLSYYRNGQCKCLFLGGCEEQGELSIVRCTM
jgi:hypothetical protein